MTNKIIFSLFPKIVIVFIYAAFAVQTVHGSDYKAYKMGLLNFVTCEMTRTGAVSHFEDKPFTITMVDLFSIQEEGDLTIITGAVRCSVEEEFHVLYVALGLETILGREKVSYFLVRKKDFSILATELIKYPYKERCPWSQYWIDID